jgi:hypothetical protein
MKTLFPALTILFFCALLFITCTKVLPEAERKTRLIITLLDDEGKSVDSAVVKLYKEGIDTPMVKIADRTGLVIYPDLEVALYRWTAQKGCKNNLASQSSLNRPLLQGLALYGSSILSARSVLKITNTASYAYKITDSTINVSIKADTAIFVYPKIGSRTLHLVPSDTLKAASNKVIQINCGDTAYIKLPI